MHPYINDSLKSYAQYGITSDYERIKPDFEKITVEIKSFEEFTLLVEDFSTCLEWLKADGLNWYYWDNDMEMLVKDFVTTFISFQDLDSSSKKQLEKKIFKDYVSEKIWIVQHKSWRTTIEEIAEKLYNQGLINVKLQLTPSAAQTLLEKVLKECNLFLPNHAKPLYKYLTVEAAKKVLLSTTFKYSSPLKFNDPFEFNSDLISFSFADSSSLEEIIKKTSAAIGINDLPWLRKQILEAVMADINEKNRRNLELLKKDSRVLCLSETNAETLMWSHYANGHSGVCLGIRMPQMKSIWTGLTLKVTYPNKQISRTFNIDNVIERQKALLRWVFIKSKHWAYEREVRIYFQNPDPTSQKVLDELFGQQSEHKHSLDNMSTYIPFESEQLCEILLRHIMSEKRYTCD